LCIMLLPISAVNELSSLIIVERESTRPPHALDYHCPVIV
jgi:hypothetical protein